MKLNCCPACGSRMERSGKVDKFFMPRFYDRCLNMACRLDGYDCAISRADWDAAQRRKRARMERERAA